jgi:hypothetical protein
MPSKDCRRERSLKRQEKQQKRMTANPPTTPLQFPQHHDLSLNELCPDPIKKQRPKRKQTAPKGNG